MNLEIEYFLMLGFSGKRWAAKVKALSAKPNHETLNPVGLSVEFLI